MPLTVESDDEGDEIKKGAVDLSAIHGTQGRRIVTSLYTPPPADWFLQ